MDADLQDPPFLLSEIFKLIKEKEYDSVAMNFLPALL